MQKNNHETVIAFPNEFINVYAVPKRIKTDRGGVFIPKKYQEICESQNINCKYGTWRRSIGRTNDPINEDSNTG